MHVIHMTLYVRCIYTDTYMYMYMHVYSVVRLDLRSITKELSDHTDITLVPNGISLPRAGTVIISLSHHTHTLMNPS